LGSNPPDWLEAPIDVGCELMGFKKLRLASMVFPSSV
jgi:hypothetical protein